MNTAELLAAAEEAEPLLMAKTAMAIAVLDRLSPKHGAELKQDLAEIAGYTTTKLAAAEGYGPLARYGAAVGGTLLAGLAGSMATDLYDTAKRGLNKGRNFRHIMLANPDLKKTEKERLHNAYDALHRYAPEFTADPMLGGSLLKSVIDLPGNEQTVIKDLINARKNLLDSRHSQYQPGKVEIDLPDQYDIAANAAARAHDLKRDADRRGFDVARAAEEARQKATAEVRRRVHEKGMARGQAANAQGLESFRDALKRKYRDDEETASVLIGSPMYPRRGGP